MKRLLLIGALLVASGAVLAVAQDPAPHPFTPIHQVLTSPRCRNCHPAGAAPLQGDVGRPHAQNITRATQKNGMPCTTCHRDHNGTRPGWPPGAHHWDMPPAAAPMVFEGRSPRALCEQLRDPAQTGNRSVADLVDHVRRDPLVLWAWRPGPGRKPPPMPHGQFVAAVAAWVDAGAPCPE